MPPFAAGFTTVTLEVPMLATSTAVMLAVKLVLETKVVGRALPFQATVEEWTKFVPVTDMVSAAAPAMAELGVRRMMAGGGGLIVKVAALEVPPPGVGVETVTMAVPTVAMSAAVMAACKLVAETKVVVRGLPFH